MNEAGRWRAQHSQGRASRSAGRAEEQRRREGAANSSAVQEFHLRVPRPESKIPAKEMLQRLQKKILLIELSSSSKNGEISATKRAEYFHRLSNTFKNVKWVF